MLTRGLSPDCNKRLTGCDNLRGSACPTLHHSASHGARDVSNEIAVNLLYGARDQVSVLFWYFNIGSERAKRALGKYGHIKADGGSHGRPPYNRGVPFDEGYVHTVEPLGKVDKRDLAWIGVLQRRHHKNELVRRYDYIELSDDDVADRY